MADSNCNRKVSNIQFLLESVEHISTKTCHYWLQHTRMYHINTLHCRQRKGRSQSPQPGLPPGERERSPSSDCRERHRRSWSPNLDCCLERGGGGVHPPTAGRGIGAGPPTPRLERGRGGVNPPTAGRGRGGVGPFTSGKGVSLPTHW